MPRPLGAGDIRDIASAYVPGFDLRCVPAVPWMCRFFYTPPLPPGKSQVAMGFL